MSKVITISACTLNQWALDFDGNLSRILSSIRSSVSAGASMRVGPELEICGYDCEDHYYESDTFLHSWQVLGELLNHADCRNILCDVGMPVMHRGVAYNCRILFYNKRIVLIRPKMCLADNGNYREHRWFKAWKFPKTFETHVLPDFIQQIDGQADAPFGDVVLESVDGVKIGWEICEELWNASSSHVRANLEGVHIVCNSSGSHHELRKTELRDQLISSATSKSGGVYVFVNLRGCDGERIYFDGCSQIVLNGIAAARAKQFSLEDVEVSTASIDLADVETFRVSISSSNETASAQTPYPVIRLPAKLLNPERVFDATITLPLSCSPKLNSVYHCAEEEISLGPALWIWDYLRRSGMRGFFVPVSGGLDSTSVACIVYSLCRFLFKHSDAQRSGNAESASRILGELRRVLRDDAYVPKSARDICGRLLTTCYMGTQNSSTETCDRAAMLANAIGSRHFSIAIDPLVNAATQVYESAIRTTQCDETVAEHGVRFQARGGTQSEDLALQNVQARSRMLTAYLFSQLLPFAGTQSAAASGKRGGLLVLASSNVDECLLGYLTKYDCSSADLCPIGSICKSDLRLFVSWCAEEFAADFESSGEKQLVDAIRSTLKRIGDAPPTAELCPLSETGEVVQTDEHDMGLTYDELNVIGRLRKQLFCGPYSLMLKLSSLWSGAKQDAPSAGVSSLQSISDKVKRFFTLHARNRHKATVLTPSYHTESYSPDDNRFDLRPFLYNTAWLWQFRKIDEFVARYTHRQ